MFKFLRKNRVAVMAVLMVFVMSGYYFLANIVNAEKGEIATELRTISLSNAPQEDYQTVFEKFDDYELNTEGTLTTFTGSQTINSSVLQEIDNLSISETENIADCQVSYEFTYDVESNVITIYAYMSNEYGEIEVDKISGVCFIDDNNEIDAVMNIGGEGILLSEMRNAGKIQNCGWGWFIDLIKDVGTAVAVTAGVVAATAAVVATCGAAAPAVAAAGVAVATAAGTAATIAAYASITAAIAAGIALTASLVEEYYPGIDATDTTINGRQTVTAKWAKEETKSAVRDLVTAETAKDKRQEDKQIFFHVLSYSKMGPVDVDLTPYNLIIMATNMRTQGWSSVTVYESDAKSVITTAFLFDGYIIAPDLQQNANSPFVSHYHAIKSDGQHVRTGPNNYVVHSYFYA